MTAPHLPTTMKAVVLQGTGGLDQLVYTEAHPTPTLSPGQLLVKNDYAGINYVDTYYRSGYYPSPKGYPLILGQEAAGTVAAIAEPNPHGFRVGDRVVWILQGGYAEFTAVPGDRVVKIPEGIKSEDAVGGFLMGMTVLSLMREAYPVRKGETVLVHAAAGGVGLLMCQILAGIGATVIGTAGGVEKCQLARENGATHMIDYRATSGRGWVEQVMELTGGEGVNVVYDSVGKDTWGGSLKVTKRKGKVVYFGYASGPVPPIDVTKWKNISIMCSTLMNVIVTREELESYANEVLKLIKDGVFRIKKHKIYPLKDASEAQRDIESRKTTGKLLLKI